MPTGRVYTLVCRADETDLARIAAFRAWALSVLVETPSDAATADTGDDDA